MKPVLALRHVAREPMGALEDALRGAGLEFRYVDLFEGLPERLALDEASGLVILGGPMNVDEVDRYPHLGVELDWIRWGIARAMPVLGVCLGAQLMAKALGARVYANRVKEIGWYRIELLPAAADDPLLSGCAPAPTVFQWHGDTFDLPAGAVGLARGALCENQAFRYGARAWGLQFHVEMTRPMIEDWLRAGAEELAGQKAIDAEAILRAMGAELPKLESMAARVLSRWAALAAAE